MFGLPRFSALAFMSWHGLGPLWAPFECSAGECIELLLCLLIVGSLETNDALCLKLEDSTARLYDTDKTTHKHIRTGHTSLVCIAIVDALGCAGLCLDRWFATRR